MEPQVIKTKDQHDKCLAEIERLMNLSPDPDSPEGNRLELLAVLVEKYEQDRYRFAKPDPVEAIKIRMDDLSLKQKDLVPFIGSSSKVSEILSRTRPLSIQMIRSLSKGLGIPADVLVQGSQNTKDSEVPAPKVTFDLPHCYLELARASWTTIHHSNLKEKEFLDEYGENNTKFSLVSMSVLYSYLALEAFINYQLYQIWERRSDGSDKAKLFKKLLNDPAKFENLKNHSKIWELKERIKTLCTILGYKDPHEKIPELWQDLNDLVKTSRHFFVHPYPDKAYFQKNMQRIMKETKAGKYVETVQGILNFLYDQGGKTPPDWLKKNTLFEFKGVELLAGSHRAN